LGGGGIYNEGTLEIYSCAISGNTAAQKNLYSRGGGIYNAGNLLVHSSLIANNETIWGVSYVGEGGGIATYGKAPVVDMTSAENTANPTNIAAYAGFGGGMYNGGELLVDRSLISRNTVAGDYYGLGGGICNGAPYIGHAGGTVTVNNSTIADNLA